MEKATYSPLAQELILSSEVRLVSLEIGAGAQVRTGMAQRLEIYRVLAIGCFAEALCNAQSPLAAVDLASIEIFWQPLLLWLVRL
jgi:hypothetical protein